MSMCCGHCSREAKEALRFPYFGSREHISDILKQNSKHVFHVVRFHRGTLFSFYFTNGPQTV